MLVTSLESSSSPRLGLSAKCLAGIVSRILQTSACACRLCNPEVNTRDCHDLLSMAALQGEDFAACMIHSQAVPFPGEKKGTIIYRSDPGKMSLSLPGFLWLSMWLMTHLCWNDHCCDKQKITDLEALTHPSSCLVGCPGELECTGVREFWSMHGRPQLLTDSTSCCWSAQPLRSPVTSLLMKERCKVLLLQPMKSDVMLYREAVQAVNWSPVI